jgi:hypothetical protein
MSKLSREEKQSMLEAFAESDFDGMCKLANKFDKEGKNDFADMVDYMIEFKKAKLEETRKILATAIRGLNKLGSSREDINTFSSIFKAVADQTCDSESALKVANEVMPSIEKEKAEVAKKSIMATTGFTDAQISGWGLSNQELEFLGKTVKSVKNPKMVVEKFLAGKGKKVV